MSFLYENLRILVEIIFFSFMNCNEDEITEESIPYAPGKCILQKNPQLFSCATKPPQNIQRLCPCRTFKKGQIVLCDKFC